MAITCRQPCDTAVMCAGLVAKPCVRRTRLFVLASTVIGSSMAFIDGTVVNVALPALQREFGATVITLQWIVESYALFLSALILVGGLLGDQYGRRRIFAVGIVLFAAASLWCGLVPDAEQLIVARAVQGIGAAFLVPGSLAIISASFGPEERGRAIGTWSGMTALAMALGPVLGGWLVDHVSWRWVFFINLPLAAVVLTFLALGVPESRDDSRAPGLDWTGAGLVTLGLGLLVFGLIEAGAAGLSDRIVMGCLASGVLLLAAFIWSQSRGRAPMMPLDLFRLPGFSSANLITLLLYAALGGALFFFPFNLIQLQGYSATGAGAAFLPLILIMFALSRWSGGLIDRYGGRLPLTIGPFIAAAGFASLAVPGVGEDYWTSFFPAIAILGLGMAISVPPLTTVVLATAEQHQAGLASGINNAVARVAGLIAIAVMGIVLLAQFNAQLDDALAALTLSDTTLQALDGERIKLAAAAVPAGVDTGTNAIIRAAITESFLSGFRLIMLIAAALAAMAAFVAALTLGPAPRGEPASVAP